MTDEEKKILAYLNKMLATFNARINATSITDDEYHQLRSSANSIYNFAQAYTHLRTRGQQHAPLPLLKEYKIETDAAKQASSLRHKLKNYLSTHPDAKRANSLANKIQDIISPERKAHREMQRQTKAHSTPSDITPVIPSATHKDMSLSDLPVELQQTILGKLSPEKRNSTAILSRHFYALANDDLIWKRDIQRAYNLTTDDITVIKGQGETHKQLYIRLRNNMDTYMLFREINTTRPVDVFNENLDELLGAELFSSLKAAKAHILNNSVRGKPVIVECHLPIELVRIKISNEDAAGIARGIRKIDSREVSFDGNQFQTRLLSLKNQPG